MREKEEESEIHFPVEKNHKRMKDSSINFGSSEENVNFEPRKTQELTKSRKYPLQIRQKVKDDDLEEVIIQKNKPSQALSQLDSPKSKNKAKVIWDDIEFDENEI